ncbi:MAG TPA: prephenate dehydratase, partial [Candidatus Binataceae bacterium]|nr:prephenate dehydratase [Candidatus Binataceae bacterium]
SKANRKVVDERADATALFKEESKPTWQPDTIEAHRARMDRINLEILKLVSERAAHANEIGRIKHTSGVAVYLPGREREVIEAMIAANPGPLSAEHVARIYTEIISACRALEHVPRVAFLGPEHTYSHEAARTSFGASVEFAPQPSFAAVFQEVQNARADFGVVPIENSTEGAVGAALDLLIDTPLVIISEILQPVRHALMSREGDPARIRRIVSHQQSLGQCRVYLSTNFKDRELEAVASNALAAQRAAQDETLGAIASRAAAEAYGLRVIAENIQDIAENTTRFLVLGSRATPKSGRDKTTILFAVPDKVGALNTALSLFSKNKINISKIESRPLRGRSWEYLFFVDLAGHREDAPVKRALTALKHRTLFLKVLGSYPEARSAAG